MRLLPVSTILILVFISFSAFGQSSYKEGYIITMEDDTLNGYVKDVGRPTQFAKECSFKTEIEDQKDVYFPDQIKGYRFNDGRYYISKKIKPDSVEKRVFLEYLVKGEVDLYYYHSPKHKIYYLKKDERMLPLAYKKIERETEKGFTITVVDDSYIGLLRAFFNDAPGFTKNVNYFNLNHNSMIDIAKDYHDYVCSGEECIIYKADHDWLEIGLRPVFSFVSNKLDVSQDPYEYLKELNGESKAHYQYGFTIELGSPYFERLSLEYSYKMSSNYTYDIETLNDYKFSGSLVGKKLEVKNEIQSIRVKYTHTPFFIKPYVGLGISFYNFKESDYTSALLDPYEEIEFNNNIFPHDCISFDVSIGLEYFVFDNLSVQVNGLYSYLIGKTRHYRGIYYDRISYNSDLTGVTVGLNYRFTLF